MNIHVNKENILPIIAQVQSLLEKRIVIPILANVLIKAEKNSIFLYASDSDLSFRGQILGKVKKPGEIVTNGRRLFEIIKELPPGEMSLSSESQLRVKIKKDSSVFQIPGLKAEDFPVFPEVKTKKFQPFQAEELVTAIDKTIYCTSLDESRYHLTGVFCESFTKEGFYRFTATDGHRMSFINVLKKDSLLDFDGGVIIPKKGLQEIKKMVVGSEEEEEEMQISLEKPRLIVKYKNKILMIRLIEGKYPNYRQLIPKQKGQEILVEREEFLAALRRVSVLTNARFKRVQFFFRKGELLLEFSQQEVGEAKEKIKCVYKGPDLKINFNSKYILDMLQSLSHKKVRILLKQEAFPGVFKGEGDENHLCIVMPMKS